MKLRENFSKDLPCKFTPALVLHVLHFIVDFFYNPRASLARTEFKRDFLDNPGARRSIAFKTFFDPRYRPPTPVLVKWSEKVKWKKSESIFGPLNLFNLRYIKEGVRGNNNIGIKKCRTIFLWVLNLGQVGKIFKNFQKHPLGEGFWKIF